MNINTIILLPVVFLSFLILNMHTIIWTNYYLTVSFCIDGDLAPISHCTNRIHWLDSSIILSPENFKKRREIRRTWLRHLRKKKGTTALTGAPTEASDFCAHWAATWLTSSPKHMKAARTAVKRLMSYYTQWTRRWRGTGRYQFVVNRIKILIQPRWQSRKTRRLFWIKQDGNWFRPFLQSRWPV